MKKSISNIIKIVAAALCTLAVVVGLTCSSVTKEATSVYGYDYFIDETNYSYYDYVVGTDNQQTTFKLVFYKTYLSTSTEAERRNEQNVQGVAVKWLSSEGYARNAISIDSSVTLNGKLYSVIAVAKEGFARSTFTTIEIPNSVKEVREGAFAHCLSLTSFTFPCMNKVSSSTFLDCRSLTQLRFRDADGNESMQNDTITEIDDHAFDSCISLTNFRCPIKVTRFGRSCFQNCRSLTSFYFPTTRYVNSVKQTITVEESAFADCTKLSTVYFESNVVSIARYAFVHCAPGLTFLCPDGISSLGTDAFDNLWRRKYLGAGVMEEKSLGNSGDPNKDFYTIDATANKIFRDDNYPGLTWSIVNTNIMMDNSLNNSLLQTSTGKYAIITEFVPPFNFQTTSGKYFYHINDKNSNGKKDDNEQAFTDNDFKFVVPTTLPDLNGNQDEDGNYTDFYTVKVIDTNAFANLDCQQRLREVIFNTGLVQIRHEAFLDCTRIAKLDFDNTEGTLLEIGYNIFHQPKSNENNESYNIYVDTIKLPQSLKYIGEFAFYNFLALSKEISFGTTPSLNVIGAYAFAVASKFGATYKDRFNEGTIDLVLPKTLSDTEGKKYQRYTTSNPKSINYYAKKGYAIGTHAFDNAINIKTVEMKDGGGALASLGSYAFKNCTNLLNFRASDKTHLLGQGLFENCTSLKEVFLTTQSSYKTTTDNEDISYPWGIKDADKTYGGSLFSGSSYSQDVVIYVTGSSAAGSSNSVSNANRWNVQTASAFANELQPSYSNRSTIPTYYSVDWKIAGNSWSLTSQYQIVYWKPADNTFLFDSPGEFPTTLNEYNGIISIVKDIKKSPYESKVVRYFAQGERTLRRYVSISGNLQWIDVKQFDGTIAYSTNDKTCVIYNGTIYSVKNNISAPYIGKNIFDTSDWTSVNALSSVSNSYSANTTYSENAFAWFKTGVSTTNTIDLTRIPTNNPYGASVDIAATMTTIGDEAFAHDSNSHSLKNLGYYFVLPTSITTIGERAFYRKGRNSYGVRVVTYKDNSGYHKPSGTLTLANNNLSTLNTALTSEFNSGGYLMLASNNKNMTIKRNAFYNNRFSSISLGDKLKFLGNGAFYTNDAVSDIDTVSFTSNDFELYKNV